MLGNSCYIHAMQVRQSLKGVKIAYVLVIVLAAALAYFLGTSDSPPVPLTAALFLPAALLLLVAIRHLRRRATSLDVQGDRLRYEAGLFSKTSRIMELAKVQDVRFDQTFGQRIIGTGDLSVETAGDSSRIVMPSIDKPREVAEHILELSRAQRAK
jgi:membrane protein YdbS with pleckstrin-like domain